MNLKYVEVFSSAMFDQNLEAFVTENSLDFVAYSNADISYVNELEDFVGFHVIRDPRDIVVSAYFSHLYSHSTEDWPELIEHRARLNKASKEDGLFLEMEFAFTRKEFEDLYNWNYSQPNVLEIRMEDLIQSPYEVMVEAFSFLGLADERHNIRARLPFLVAELSYRIRKMTRGLVPFFYAPKTIPVQVLLGIVYQNRFAAKSGGRKPGNEDVKTHYRKGMAGDWVNHFNSEHREYFRSRFNDLLFKLRYETTPNW